VCFLKGGFDSSVLVDDRLQITQNLERHGDVTESFLVVDGHVDTILATRFLDVMLDIVILAVHGFGAQIYAQARQNLHAYVGRLEMFSADEFLRARVLVRQLPVFLLAHLAAVVIALTTPAREHFGQSNTHCSAGVTLAHI